MKDRSNDTLLNIAFKSKNIKTLKILIQKIDSTNKLDEKYVKEAILEGEMFYDEIFLRNEKKLKPLCPLIFLEPKCLIPFEMQISLIYNFPRLIKKTAFDPEIAKE